MSSDSQHKHDGKLTQENTAIVCVHVSDNPALAVPNEDGDALCSACWHEAKDKGFDAIKDKLVAVCKRCLKDILNQRLDFS